RAKVSLPIDGQQTADSERVACSPAVGCPPSAVLSDIFKPRDSFPLKPRDVFEELRRTVVGQDDAIREIAVALVKHQVGHPQPNILLIGNSGSGKTTLMRSVESFLASKPELRSHFANVVRINANV